MSGVQPKPPPTPSLLCTREDSSLPSGLPLALWKELSVSLSLDSSVLMPRGKCPNTQRPVSHPKKEAAKGESTGGISWVLPSLPFPHLGTRLSLKAFFVPVALSGEKQGLIHRRRPENTAWPLCRGKGEGSLDSPPSPRSLGRTTAGPATSATEQFAFFLCSPSRPFA